MAQYEAERFFQAVAWKKIMTASIAVAAFNINTSQ